MHTWKWISNILILLTGTLVVCMAGAAAAPDDLPAKVDAAGVPNLIHVADNLYSGAMPEGDAGFESLKKLGVRTIISVDGAKPDLARAHKYGMRYVHLPMGYDGVTHEQALKLARAVQDLPGPFYIHCHRGTQRGPTAAAVARLCQDDQCTVEKALEGMKLAGFDMHYTGLYAAAKEFKRPTAEELKQVSGEFPEAAPPAGLKQFMVDIDNTFGNLQAIRKAGWKTPKDHSDLDPPHEALQLVEHFKELRRLPKTAERPEDFRAFLAAAEDRAQQFEDALRAPPDKADVEAAYKRMDAACVKCHGVYRDVPKK
jgi:protein tyrosine phosphatase (PTP) superfamily phosphohydrolase (DUF442 family)